MSLNIAWVIDWMECKPVEGQYTDVVIAAGWRCNGIQVEESGIPPLTYTATVYNTCSFPMLEGSFTPYADLTQDQVLGWAWANGVDKDAVEAAVAQQIENQINPPVITPPLPWSAV